MRGHVLVCGGRAYNDRETVYRILDGIAERGRISRIIQGGASGADKLARDWCVARGISYAHFPANWKVFGNAAGPMRNQQMIDEGDPELVIAFPGGRGTADMLRRAHTAQVQVIEVSV